MADFEVGIDLDDERQRYILDVYEQLATITHYALLQVPRTADGKAVKTAYYRIAGVVHPDRYFGKRLGSYKPKMEQIFTQLNLAFQTLSSAPKRAKYDAALDAALAHNAKYGNEAEPALAAPVDPRLAAKREAAREALKAQFHAGKEKARQHAEIGARARAAGDVVAAAAAYKTAMTFSPGDPELKAAYDETQRAFGEKLAESHMRKALIEERFGRWAAAAESWQRVMSAKPNDPEIHTRLANALARAREQAGG